MPISLADLTQAATYLGAAIAMGFGAIGSGAGEGYTAAQVTPGMARQPAVRNELLKTMLIGQAIAETSGIFSLVVAVLLVFGSPGASLPEAVALVAAGIAVGFGAVGSGIGGGIAAGKACSAIARRPDLSSILNHTMLLGSAVAQSTSIYGFIVAMLLMYFS